MRIPTRTGLAARPLYVALVVALLLLAAWGLWPRAVEVETAVVGTAPLETGFTEEGRTPLRAPYEVSCRNRNSPLSKKA